MIQNINFRKELADYNNVEKYAQVKEDGTIERWNESVRRIWDMHRKKVTSDSRVDRAYQRQLSFLIDRAERFESEKKFLSSQRARQWGGTGRGILDKNERIYNCTASYADRPEFFGEMMYLLLCGCGVGYSICKRHVNKLPAVRHVEIKGEYFVEDTIEGWADAAKEIANAFFSTGILPEIRYTKIRPKGSLISGRFIHGGYEPLEKAFNAAIKVFMGARGRRLKPIEVYDICCFLAEAVLSGGVRRSATIAIFSWDDDEMLQAKTGRTLVQDEVIHGVKYDAGTYVSWFVENPQRAMSNNSPMLVRSKVKIEDVRKIVEMCKLYGEPGVLFAENEDVVLNPCAEIGMIPKTADGKSGWQFCNLVEINLGVIKTPDEFYAVCSAASFSATVQASYDNFPYLGKTTMQIVQGAALIGVSITGYMDKKFEYTPEILQNGAEIVKKTNAETALMLGIMPARRCTTMKPSGNASILLQTTAASNPYHSRRYLRHVRLNKHKGMYDFICKNAPELIVCHNEHYGTQSTGSAVVAFPIDASDASENGYREDYGFLESADRIAYLYDNWVLKGDRGYENVTHNISNTLTVKNGEWDLVADKLFELKNKIGGISILSDFGDKVYPYAPNCSVPSLNKITEMLERLDKPNFGNEVDEIIENCREYKLDFFQQVSYMNQEEQLVAKNMWAYSTFEYIKENYSNPDFYLFKKINLENIGDQAATACMGGACTLK